MLAVLEEAEAVGSRGPGVGAFGETTMLLDGHALIQLDPWQVPRRSHSHPRIEHYALRMCIPRLQTYFVEDPGPGDLTDRLYMAADATTDVTRHTCSRYLKPPRQLFRDIPGHA